MQRVQTALFHPGECLFGGGSFDLVDTGKETPDGRVYVGMAAAQEIGLLAGLVMPQALAAVVEDRDRLQIELDASIALLAEAQALLEAADKLRHAVAYTLEHATVIDVKRGTVGLRSAPGQMRVDLARELVLASIVAREG